MLNWIKLEPGCEMPDADEKVIWRHQNGEYGVFEIGKDKYWFSSIKHTLTHWAKIDSPFEELPREAEKYFNDEQGALWDDAVNIICEHLGEELPSPSSIEDCKKRYIISRK